MDIDLDDNHEKFKNIINGDCPFEKSCFCVHGIFRKYSIKQKSGNKKIPISLTKPIVKIL